MTPYEKQRIKNLKEVENLIQDQLKRTVSRDDMQRIMKLIEINIELENYCNQ